MKIRIMADTDARRVSELEQVSFSRPWSEQGLIETLRGGQALFLVAESGEDILGYVGMTYAADEGEITNVAVFPEHKRKGVGQDLMRELEVQAKTLGVAAIFLDVRVSNEPAIALYNKLGYEMCGTRKRFYDFPVEDAYVMKLEIKG